MIDENPGCALGSWNTHKSGHSGTHPCAVTPAHRCIWINKTNLLINENRQDMRHNTNPTSDKF